MESSYSITCGISCCCCNNVRPQTRASIGLRTTAVVLGALALLAGILIICGIFQVGNAAGWLAFSIGCVFVALATCIKAVKKRSIAYEEIRGIDHQALEAIQSQDAQSVLSKYYSEHQAWPLAIYQMIGDSRLEEEGCHPILHIGDFSVMDAIAIEHRSETIYTTDWFSTSIYPCYPVTLKIAMNALSESQRGLVVDALNGIPQDDELVLDVMKRVNALAESLQRRYSFVEDNVPSLIFDLIKEVIQDLNIDSQDDLVDHEIINKICTTVAIRLLSYAEISEKDQALSFGEATLRFGKIERERFWDAKIPNFFVNELTSFDYHDEPVVDMQPLYLAIELKKINNPRIDDPTLSAFLIPIANLLMSRYYSKFMTAYMNHCKDVLVKKPIKDKSLEYSEASNKKVKNNLWGNKFDIVIKTYFSISPNPFNGHGNNCILSAILIATEPNKDYSQNRDAGNLRIKEIRNQIAAYLIEHKEKFISFFPNEHDFNDHVQDLPKMHTFLGGVDFEVLAQVIGHPLYIYQQEAKTFFVNDNGEPIPSIFGGDLTGSPIYLYEQGVHYDLLIRK